MTRPSLPSAGAFRQFQYPTPPLGTSDSGFRAEVESEQALTRGEFYTEKIEAHEHTDFQGPAAEEAAARLQHFGARTQFQGQLALSKNRLLRIMKRHDPGVYPGTYITCVHDPAKALCEKARRGRGENLPEHGGCLPLACRNVALTGENTQAWRRELDRIERRLTARPLLPPLVLWGAATITAVWSASPRRRPHHRHRDRHPRLDHRFRNRP